MSITMNWEQTMASQQRQNPLETRGRRPNPIDMSEQWVINDNLAIGLFKGKYPGMKLASAIARTMIVVPVAFMGLPIPRSKHEPTQKALTEIQEWVSRDQQKTYLIRRIVGTGWRWPTWDSRSNRIRVELIPNSSLTDIIRNIDTGEIMKMIITEQITVQSAENTQSIVTRKRIITRDRIKVEYTGQVPAGLTNRETRNPAGVMPIPFPNDVLDSSVRGDSSYGPVISDFKNIHDTDLKWAQTLNKFNVKLVQTITGNSVDDWLDQNAMEIDDIDVEQNEVFFNKTDEKSEFIFPEHAVTEAFKARFEVSLQKIIMAGGVPEMFYGLIATGNHASADQQLTLLENTVEDDKNQIDGPEHEFYDACLRLMSVARMTTYADHTHEWNDLETVSQETKAKIFQAFGEAVARLTQNASVPLQTLHKMFLTSFPKATVSEFKEFMEQMNLAAKYKQFQSASLADAADMAGAEGSEEVGGGE